MTRKFENNPLIKGPCPDCGAVGAWLVMRFVNAAGATTYPWCCTQCAYKSNLSEAKWLVKLDKVPPPEYKARIERPRCARCGEEGAAEHHWAPKHLFDDAYSWPTSYLCKKHHKEWHTKVTPQMCEAKK